MGIDVEDAVDGEAVGSEDGGDCLGYGSVFAEGEDGDCCWGGSGWR